MTYLLLREKERPEGSSQTWTNWPFSVRARPCRLSQRASSPTRQPHLQASWSTGQRLLCLLQDVHVPCPVQRKRPNSTVRAYRPFPTGPGPLSSLTGHGPLVPPLLLLLTSDQSPLRMAVPLDWGPAGVQSLWRRRTLTQPSSPASHQASLCPCGSLRPTGLLSGSPLRLAHPPLLHQT